MVVVKSDTALVELPTSVDDVLSVDKIAVVFVVAIVVELNGGVVVGIVVGVSVDVVANVEFG